MEGIILTFGENLSATDMVKRHNEFMGRVVKVKRGGSEHYYYYPGILHDIPFFKLSNGCYFIVLPKQENVELRTPGDGPIKSELDIKEEKLKTGAAYFLEKYKGIKVNNLE